MKEINLNLLCILNPFKHLFIYFIIKKNKNKKKEMPVIYNPGIGRKGLLPCSKMYQRTLENLYAQQKYDILENLFRQAHQQIWRLNSQGNTYINVYNPSVQIDIAEYTRIANLPGSQINPHEIQEQCKTKTQPFIIPDRMGPQFSVVSKALKRAALLQLSTYEEAERQGKFPVNYYRNNVIYAPSPFRQDCVGEFCVPENQDHQAGRSGGSCDLKTVCSDPDTICEQGMCVVSPDKRECPPFQYNAKLRHNDNNNNNNNSDHVVQQFSRYRSQKTKRYSPKIPGYYDVCVAPFESKYDQQQWITDPIVRQYLGLPNNIKFLPRDQFYELLYQLPMERRLIDPNTKDIIMLILKMDLVSTLLKFRILRI